MCTNRLKAHVYFFFPKLFMSLSPSHPSPLFQSRLEDTPSDVVTVHTHSTRTSSLLLPFHYRSDVLKADTHTQLRTVFLKEGQYFLLHWQCSSREGNVAALLFCQFDVVLVWSKKELYFTWIIYTYPSIHPSIHAYIHT